MLNDSVTMFAYAKVNLALAITGRQEGFHRLETVMQSIETHDVVRVERKGTGITCECGDFSGPQNLAFKAAAIFLRQLGRSEGIEINITKTIPAQAGLAGGSSDAAAVLQALNELFLKPFVFSELAGMARQCGSDVPFCLSGGTKWATGRGDQLEDIPEASDLDFVLIKPQRGVDTTEAYQCFATQPAYRHLEREAWELSLTRGDKEGIARLLSNDLERAAETLVPEIAAAKRKLREVGCLGTLMSGSGSAVFGIARDSEQARFFAERLQQSGFNSWATRSVGAKELERGKKHGKAFSTGEIG